MKASPLLIVGTSRSGSTLLSRIVNNHPKLSIMPESWVFSCIQLLNLKDYPKNFEYKYLGKQLYNSLKDYDDNAKTVVKKYFDANEDLRGKELSQVVMEIGHSYAKSNNKEFWGEKTPAHALRLKRIYDLFPEATIVWIIRDPRDVIVSYIKRWNNNDFADEKFILNTAVLLKYYYYKLIEENPYENTIKIRYEQLTKDPNKQMGDLFSKLGLEFESEYLNTKNFIINNDEAAEAHKNLNRKVNTDSVGSYKKIPNGILQKVELLLKSEMQYLEYKIDNDVNLLNISELSSCLRNFEDLKSAKTFKKNRMKGVLRMYYNHLNPFK
ncbi:sulfotransferase family protein [Psychroserpens damuponensis]|uniref:sulfotransferase family protein n=1 Tax=Psychroserpens damuponensis TaxID=943936 RepID=UPI000590904D|nr:sulfotransferase [Psychroserpens damuponensis]